MIKLTESDRISGIELSLIRQVINCAIPDSINLALGELRYPLPELLRNKALEILRTINPVYTPNAGLPALREAIANYHFNLCHPDQICVTNGAEEAIYTIFSALVNKGDRVAIPDPDYTAYPAIANMMQAEIIRLPFDPDLLNPDWEKWEQELAKGVKVLILSSPQNPTGYCFISDESSKPAERLIRICEKYGVILIVDEIYRELYCIGEQSLRAGKPLTMLMSYDDLFIVGGLSKSHAMSGWRLGWIISPAGFSASIIKTRQYISTCASHPAQELAVFALSPEGMKAVQEIRNMLYMSRLQALDILNSAFSREYIHLPAASPYLMLNVQQDSIKVAMELASRGVITVPGTAFGKLCSHWLRINFGLEISLLQKGLKIITGFLT